MQTFAELHAALRSMPWTTAAERRRQRKADAQNEANHAVSRADNIARHGRYVCVFCEIGVVAASGCTECEGPVSK